RRALCIAALYGRERIRAAEEIILAGMPFAVQSKVKGKGESARSAGTRQSQSQRRRTGVSSHTVKIPTSRKGREKWGTHSTRSESRPKAIKIYFFLQRDLHEAWPGWRNWQTQRT